MSNQQHFYPPPPGAPGSAPPPPAQQQHHQHYAPPPVSPPANKTQFYPTPTSPPANKTQFYPPPPPQASPGQKMSYPPPPPQQASSPPPPFHQPSPVHYPPPPASGPVPQTSPPPPATSPSAPQQQNTLAMRPAETYPADEKFPPPPPSQPEQSPHASEFSGVSHEDEKAQQAAAPAGTVKMISGAPPAELFVGATATTDDVGTFNGGSYRISHRDSNTILTIQLAMGCPFDAKPGSMIAMSPSVTLRGQWKFSMKKMMAGADIGSTTLIGPGEVLLAPPMLGDIATLRLSGNEMWSVGQDAYLGSTQGIKKDHKRQGIGKAMFSGEGLFVYKMSGTGLLWLISFGAIIKKTLIEGEKYIVDNGHLVAWNTKYVIERVASGGMLHSFAAGEGLVCKFTGPGTVYMQTRNGRTFGAWMSGQSIHP